MKLASFTGLPAIDPGQHIEIGIESCQPHTGSLGICRRERINEPKARPMSPYFEGSQDGGLLAVAEPT